MKMPEIKTRDVVNGTIKTVDRAALAGQRMKNAYVQTKRRAEESVSAPESSSEEYATDRISEGTETVVNEVVHHGQKIIHRNHPRAVQQIKKQKQNADPKPHINPIPESPPPVRTEGTLLAKPSVQADVPLSQPGHVPLMPDRLNSSGRTIKTMERAGKTVKHPGRTIKTASSTVKTVEQVGSTTIKTSWSAAIATQKSAAATAKAVQRIRVAAKAAATTAKAVAAAASKAVKTIIAAAQELIAAIAAGGWVAILVVVVILMIGLIAGSSFGVFLSSEDAGDGALMRDAIRAINMEYQRKMDSLKREIEHDKLEITGARAAWPQVLSVYAVMVTSDPDHPQEVATMDESKQTILKDLFWQMHEIRYKTEIRIEHELVETEDEEGNLVEEWVEVEKTYLLITVTHKTAEEMATVLGFDSEQKEMLRQLLAEENKSLWANVLYGSSIGSDRIVEVAQSQIGNVGGQPYWSWYGFTSRVEWCAIFVSWCANECGYIEEGIIPKFAGCLNGVQWFQDRGQWMDNSAEPLPGMIIFFDWEKESDGGGLDGLPDHVAIVEKVENGRVYTIEGNTSDSCRERSYLVGHYEILGYGAPDYQSVTFFG